MAGDIGKRDELNPFRDERGFDSRIAKHFHLFGTLDAIHRVQTIIERRMTTQFGYPRRQSF